MHTTHGDAWVRRLAGEGGAVREACEATLRRNRAETLCWFGPAGDTSPLQSSHILDACPDTLRARFLARVGPIITAERLALPVQSTKKGARFELTESLPWDRWDATTYRLAPAATPA